MAQVSLEEIDALEAKCNAHLDELAAVEKELRPGLPLEAHRRLLMAGYTSPIAAVRQLLKDEKVE
jgi:hypothetical protein